MFDCDKFKKVNDRYGHQAGDEVLKHLVNIAQSHLRETDTLARHGGEEFVILVPETDVTGALALAERLRRSFETSPVEYNGESICVTASFGVAGNPHGELPHRLMLMNADRALYEAKRQGRNRVASNNGRLEQPAEGV